MRERGQFTPDSESRRFLPSPTAMSPAYPSFPVAKIPPWDPLKSAALPAHPSIRPFNPDPSPTPRSQAQGQSKTGIKKITSTTDRDSSRESKQLVAPAPKLRRFEESVELALHLFGTDLSKHLPLPSPACPDPPPSPPT